ncbi:MAG: PaaI family thioesterase [Hyphomonadaceae bacterium]
MNGEGNAPTLAGGAVVVNEGPFAGWITWGLGGDPYETAVGPFYFRGGDGPARCAFQPRRDHLNGGGTIHGGALMSFADFALFAIAYKSLESTHAVTLTCHSEFVGAGTLDGLVEAEGEVIRDTRSIIFVRGLVTQASRPLLSFSGTLKKMARRD